MMIRPYSLNCFDFSFCFRTALLLELYTLDSTLFTSQEIINKIAINRRLTVNNINLRTKMINNVVKSYEAKH